jgi:hypothetical protein
MENMNIYQRLNEVRKKVAYLKKDKSVQGQYNAIEHDAVTSAVREPFIEHGIMIIPSQIEGDTEQVGETSKGNPVFRYTAKYQINFVNMDDPNDNFDMVMEAHANDSGDKAPGKALSYATKYALLKVLNIETGESDESRIEIAKRNQKPELTTDHPKWDNAVVNLADGKTTMDKIKKYWTVSPLVELELIKQAKL